MTADFDKVFPASDAISAFQRRIIAGVAGALPVVYMLARRNIISLSTLEAVDFSIISVVFPAIIFFIYAIGFLYETILFRVIVPGVFFSVKNAFFPLRIHEDIKEFLKKKPPIILLLAAYLFALPILLLFPFFIIIFGLVGLSSKVINIHNGEGAILNLLNYSKIKTVEVNAIILSRNISIAEAKYVNDCINSLKSNVVYGSIVDHLFVGFLLYQFGESYNIFGKNIPWYIMDALFIYMLYTLSGLFAFYPYKSDLKALIASLELFIDNTSGKSHAP